MSPMAGVALAGGAGNIVGTFLNQRGQEKGAKALYDDQKKNFESEQAHLAAKNERFDQTLGEVESAPYGSRVVAATGANLNRQLEGVTPAVQAGGKALGVGAGNRAALMTKLLPLIRARAGAAGAAHVKNLDQNRLYELSEDLRRLEGRQAALRSLAPAKRDLAAMRGEGDRVNGQMLQMAGQSAMGY